MRWSASVEERFWSKVDRSGGPESCWPWTGYRDPNGYGKFHLEGEAALAHRVAWALTVGPIPDGLLALHRCDNPPCVNPAHLFVGTQVDNLADMTAKGRHGPFVSIPRGERWHEIHHDLPVGENASGAKLTEAAVRDIRARRVAGETIQSIALRYGVSFGAVQAVASRRTWNHVP